MKNVLDNDLNNPPPDLRKKDRQAFIYSLIMLIGGVAVFRYLMPGMIDKDLWNLVVESFIFQVMCIGLGIVIKLIRRLFKSTDEILFSKRFWLDAVEEGFSVWVLLVLLYAVRMFV
ncbi:hypothetical protein [Lewinella cohaerens]|uniref:hypothetical protein n=1 Tax=Lewinella cohaerens TaxID=70995 RepID=UPI00035C31ED|nr:hypothetical protein [Lewinella cohaerens]